MRGKDRGKEVVHKQRPSEGGKGMAEKEEEVVSGDGCLL